MPLAFAFDSPSARAHAFHRTADPDRLWPNLPRAARLDGHQRIVAATRSVLLGDPNASLEGDDPAAVRAIGIAAFEAGMGPLLGRWVEDQLLRTTPRLSSLLATHLEHGRRRAQRLGTVTRALLIAFRQRAIPATLLKGAHTAYAYFPDPGTRAGADVDVLVAPRQFPLACDALRACGLIESRRTEKPFRSEWIPLDHPQVVQSLEFNHADNPWAIDVHVSLDRLYFGNLRASLGAPDPAQRAEHVFDGVPAWVLKQPLLAAYLAIHAAWEIHQIQLVHLVELVLVVRHDTALGLLDPDTLVALLERTGCSRFAYPAFALAEHLAPGTVPSQVLHQLESAASRAARRVVGALGVSGSYRLPRRSVEEKLMWANGLREKGLTLIHGMWTPGETGSLRGGLALLLRRVRMLLNGRAGFRAPSRLGPQRRR